MLIRRELRVAVLASTAFLLVPAAAARAQTAGASGSPAAEPAQAAGLNITFSPAKKKLKLGRSVDIKVTMRPPAAGQEVVVEITHNGQSIQRTLAIKPVAGKDYAEGSFSYKAEDGGKFDIVATHAASSTVGALKAGATLNVRFPALHKGQRGKNVKHFQQLLAKRGYAVRPSGRFDSGTGRAVLAFRKVNGMARNQTAPPKVFRKLSKGGEFPLKFPGAGRHAEVDIGRQVLVLAEGGRPKLTYPASTGKSSTPTVQGTFHVYSKTAGYNAKRMYFSSFFTGGYAVHGYNPVPVFPASHGCVRVPIANAVSIYSWMSVGTSVYVYGGGKRKRRKGAGPVGP